MTIANIIYHKDYASREEEIRTLLASGNISVDQMKQGDPTQLSESQHPCIHILANPMGLSTQEEQMLVGQLSHRFLGAETAMTAQSIFSQILIGLHNQTLHLFIPFNKTLLGNLSFVLSQISNQEPISEPSIKKLDSAPTKAGMQVSQIQFPAPSTDTKPTGWQEIVNSLGGTIDMDTWTDISVRKPAPVRNILEQAGKRAIVRFENQAEYTAYGYPNLSQSNAKVLLIGSQGGHLNIIALHRAPQKVGVVSPYGCRWLPKTSLMELSKEITGRFPPKTDATVFAIDSRSMYYESAGTIYQWDGKKERNVGNPNQALSTLLLQWSQR